MKDLRRRFNRFCFQHRNKGIPNLMLYVSLGSALVYIMNFLDQNFTLYYLLCFDRELILQGQVWRLISYPLTYMGRNIVWTAVGLMCYYSIGRAMENIWGTFKFNLFYLSGILMMDIFCLIFNGMASVSDLNLSLFLAYATLFPSAQFLIFFIIPVKAWVLAVFYLAITFYNVIIYSIPYFYFPYNMFPLIALANYFLFFGKDIANVFPMSWRANASRLFKKKKKYAPTQEKPKVVPFVNAGSYEATTAKVKAPYTHKCTVCGRTDVSNPELEFRYCSRCSGYHCYCEEHINNHSHVE